MKKRARIGMNECETITGSIIKWVEKNTDSFLWLKGRTNKNIQQVEKTIKKVYYLTILEKTNNRLKESGPLLDYSVVWE